MTKPSGIKAKQQHRLHRPWVHVCLAEQLIHKPNLFLHYVSGARAQGWEKRRRKERKPKKQHFEEIWKGTAVKKRLDQSPTLHLLCTCK